MKVIYYEDKYLESLNELLNETFHITKSYKNNSEDVELIMISDDIVIGYLCLNKCIDLITGKNYFYVNYVCVKEDYRRCGVATSLFQKVFEICQKLGISYLELTSNSSRCEAHSLYNKLGFSIRNTTVFRKELV